jgi:hypothetical protein
MKLESILPRWLRRTSGKGRRDALNRFARSRRLSLERLEDRCLLAARAWTGAGLNDLWSNPANWDGGTTVPASGDDVTIANVAGSSEVIFDQSATRFGATLSLGSLVSDEPFRITDDAFDDVTQLNLSGPGTFRFNNTLTMSAGFLFGDGTVTVEGLLTWSGGEIGGTGITNANAGLVLTGFPILAGTRTMNNAAAAIFNGTANWSVNAHPLSVFNNLATGSFTIDGNNDYSGGTFNNMGTFIKRAGASGDGISRFGVFNQTSATAVDLQSGTLQLGGGTHTGDFDFTNAVLELRGTSNFDSGSDLTGTTFKVTDGVHNFNLGSSYTVTGSSTFSGGTTTFNSSVAAVSGAVTINGGVANVNQNLSTTTLNLFFGTLGGSGTVDVSGLTTWSGGNMSGSGITNANGGLALTGFRVDLLNSRTINNAGPATFNGTANGFVSADGLTVFNNLATGSFTIDGNNDYSGGTFNNMGTFIKRAGASGDGISAFRVFNQTSAIAVDVQSGTLRLTSGTHTGDFDFTGAVLELGPVFGTSNFNSGSDLTGTTLNVTAGNHSFNAGSSFNVTGSSTFLAFSTTTFNGSALALSEAMVIGGTVNVNQNFRTTNLTLFGTLGGSGTVDVAGLTTWFGAMIGSGVTNANGGLTLSGSPNNSRTVNNAAAASFNGTASSFFSNGGGGIFNNLAGGRFTIDGNNGISGGVFNNMGTLIKRAGASGNGITRFTSSFSNPGTLDVQSGTLQLESTFSNFSSSTKTLAGGAFLVAGTFRFPNADIVTNDASIVLSGAASQILNHNTSGNGIANFSSNTAAAHFTLVNRNLGTNAAGALFGNAGNMIFDGGTFTVAGSSEYRQTGGNTTLVHGGLIAPLVNIEAGTLGGNGMVTGAVNNTGGAVTPGLSPGIVTVTGDYDQASAGALNVEIAGRAPAAEGVPGTDFDQLDVRGNATLSGTLNISVLASFVPVPGDVYPIIPNAAGLAGTFSTVNGSQINTDGFFFDPEYTPTAFNLVVSRLDAGPDLHADEATPFDLLATFTDPGDSDSYTATIDWGNGSAVEAGTVDQNNNTISGSHTYGDNGVFTIIVRLFGADGSRATDRFILTVDNVSPTADAGGPYDAPEGGVVELTGTGSDVAGANDPLTFTWDLDGDGLFGETGAGAARGDEVGANPTFNAAGLDGPSVVIVTLRVNDGDGGVTDDTATIHVTNVAPSADAGGPYDVPEGSTVALTGTGSDVAGANDPLTFTWDLDGDGIFGETGVDATRGDEVGANPTFNAAGLDGPSTFIVTLRVNDGDGGVTDDTATIHITNVAPSADAGGPYNVLREGVVELAGSGSDVAGANDPLTFTWDLDGDGIFGETGADAARGDEVGTNPTFNAAGLPGRSIVVVTLRVNDGDGGITDDTATINVSKQKEKKKKTHAAAGHDVLIAGAGRDLLIGLGKDRIVGNSDDDIIIAGNLAYQLLGDDINDIMAKWTSARDYTTRVANLRGEGPGPRLNGFVFLEVGDPEATVFDDDDKLTGASGMDWFFANLDDGTLDTITDQHDSEFGRAGSLPRRR